MNKIETDVFNRYLEIKQDIVNNLKEVPDPYYGGNRGFEDVFEMIEKACINLLEHIKRTNINF